MGNWGTPPCAGMRSRRLVGEGCLAAPLHLPTQSVSSCHDCTLSSHTPSPSVPSLSPSPAAQDRQPWTASPQPPPLPLGCAEQPEGLPGITGLSVTLRPFPSLWSRGHTAPGLKVTAGGGKKGSGGKKGVTHQPPSWRGKCRRDRGGVVVSALAGPSRAPGILQQIHPFQTIPTAWADPADVGEKLFLRLVHGPWSGAVCHVTVRP